MPAFAANLSMMFQELEFLDRFAAAAKAGFRGVEFLFPYQHRAADIVQRLQECKLTQALFNLPPGDWDKGERGLACLPGREADFAAALAQAIDYARALRCENLHVMAGIAPAGTDHGAYERTYVANLRHAARQMAQHGIHALIEPINNRDIPGYFLNTTGQARKIMEQVGSDNLFLQFDIYHRQMMEGNIADAIKNNFPVIRHFQIAGVPGRHEPNVGEINYPYLFELIDSLGYQGWIGCEYRPRGATLSGLDWARSYLS